MEDSRNIIKAIDALTLKAGGEVVDSKNITEAIDRLKAVYDESAIGIDKTLTQEGLAADAKAAGNVVNTIDPNLDYINSGSILGYVRSTISANPKKKSGSFLVIGDLPDKPVNASAYIVEYIQPHGTSTIHFTARPVNRPEVYVGSCLSGTDEIVWTLTPTREEIDYAKNRNVIITGSTKLSHSLSIPNNSRHYVIITGSHPAAYWIGYLYMNTIGDIHSVAEVGKGDLVSSVGISNGSLVIEFTSETDIKVMDLVISGNSLSAV